MSPNRTEAGNIDSHKCLIFMHENLDDPSSILNLFECLSGFSAPLDTAVRIPPEQHRSSFGW